MERSHRSDQEFAIFFADSIDIRERLSVINQKLLVTLGNAPSTLDVMEKIGEQQKTLYLLVIDPDPLQEFTDAT